MRIYLLNRRYHWIDFEFRCIKEIEWWNEITPWKNSESKEKKFENIQIKFSLDFNMKIISKENDLSDDSMDSDYNTKRKRRVDKKENLIFYF